MEHVVHPFEPIWNNESRILILGTLPSIKSRENEFYYGHKQNRFWKVIANIFGSQIPKTNDEKKKLLLDNHIALWDVIYSCDIEGSSDSSIRNVIVTDLSVILNNSRVTRIYANGNKAGELYNKYQKDITKKDIVILPSTSPANAAWNMEKLVDAWKSIR